MGAGGQQKRAVFILLKEQGVTHVWHCCFVAVEVGLEASDDVSDAGVELFHLVQKKHLLVLVQVPDQRQVLHRDLNRVVAVLCLFDSVHVLLFDWDYVHSILLLIRL